MVAKVDAEVTTLKRKLKNRLKQIISIIATHIAISKHQTDVLLTVAILNRLLWKLVWYFRCSSNFSVCRNLVPWMVARILLFLRLFRTKAAVTLKTVVAMAECLRLRASRGQVHWTRRASRKLRKRTSATSDEWIIWEWRSSFEPGQVSQSMPHTSRGTA